MAKRKLRMKKSARRTIGVVTLVTALVVAAIPTPSTSAAGTKATEHYTLDAYTSDPTSSSTYETLAYNIDTESTAYSALTIERDSQGDWKLTNGYELHLTKATSGTKPVSAGQGVVTDFNHNSTSDSLVIKPRVVTYFPEFTEEEIDLWYSTESGGAGHKDDVIKWKATGEFSGDYEYYFGKDEDDATYMAAKKAKEDWDAMTTEERDAAIAQGKSDPGEASRPDMHVYDLTGDQKNVYFCYHYEAASGDSARSLSEIRGKISELYSKTTVYKLTMVTDETTSMSVVPGATISSKTVYIPMNTSADISATKDYNAIFYTKDANRVYIYYIGNGAFAGATYRNIEIPEDILQIGNEAFMNCRQLTSVSAYAGIIGNRAFYNCTSLNNVDIELGKSTAIGTECFYNCNSLTTIKFPNGIEYIGIAAFAECDYLNNVDLGEITGGFIIKEYAFYNCPSINNVQFAKSGENGHIKEIQKGAFGLVGLSPSGSWVNVEFPISIDTLGDGVLYGRSNMKTVVMPGGYGATKNVTLPNAFFAGCSSLEYVTFPETAGRVDFGLSAFSDVDTESFYIRGPKYYTGTSPALERKAAWNAGIPYVYNDGTDHWEYGSGGYLFDVDTQTGELTSCSLFDNASWDGEIELPKKVGSTTVTGIKNGCFDNSDVKNGLKRLIIPDDTEIKTIADETFMDFPVLEYIYLGDSVDTVGNKAFYNCPKLKTVVLGDGKKNNNNHDKDGVKSIGDNCFSSDSSHASALETVTFGSALENIGNYAFYDCKNLETVVFEKPENTATLAAIPSEAFHTNGSKLTFYGSIDQGYAPLKWAMAEDNFVNSEKLLRVCYKSGTPQAPELTILRDNKSGVITLVDYPHYENLDTYYPGLTTKYEKYLSGDYTDASQIAMSNDEASALDHVLNINVPAGIESIDVSAYLKATTENGNNISAYLNTPAYNTYKATYKDYGLFGGFYGKVTGTKGLREYPTGDENELVDRGNDRILSVTLNDVTSLPDNCFYSCENLQSVVLGDDLTEMGESPFAGCQKLTSIGGNAIYKCENGIIYEDNGDGNTIVECLSSRGLLVGESTVSSASDSLLPTVSKIRDGAFKDCDGIFSVDCSDSTKLTTIPENCFESCDSLMIVNLPDSVDEVQSGAFKDDNRYITVTLPDVEVDIADDAFTSTPILRSYTPSAVQNYANRKGYQFEPISSLYAVYFLDYDGTPLCDVQYIADGGNAVPPADPVRTNYDFIGWSVDYNNIHGNTVIVAKYAAQGGSDVILTFAPTLTASALTEAATISGAALTNAATVSQAAATSAAALTSAAKKGSSTPGVSPAAQTSPGVTAALTPNASTAPASSSMYTLTVVNGSGSGSYAAGATVNISANSLITGLVFKNWTSTSNDFNIVSSLNSVTTITMPAHDLTITANFGEGSGSGTPGSGTNNNNNSSTPGGSNSGNNSGTGTGTGTINGTTVNITKPGISNKDVANAYVTGSTDNFKVQISDSDAARYAVEQALISQYGSLDNLSYYAMDISLYDETGTTKIEDTTGLTITVTMPIPDDLVKYAGNNQVMAVVNGNTYEAMEGRFTTISGVPCISFTCTHFSPYAIYVNRAQMSGNITDDTPKTGDFLHPKYFIAIALGCVALILLLKRDKKTKSKTT